MATATISAAAEAQRSEAWDLFDSVCQHYLNLSGSDFLERWNSGAITPQDAEADTHVARVVSVLPFTA